MHHKGKKRRGAVRFAGGVKKGRPFGQPSNASAAFLTFGTLDLLDGGVDAEERDRQNGEGEQGEKGLHAHHDDLRYLVDVDGAGNIARKEKSCNEQDEKGLVEHDGFLRNLVVPQGAHDGTGEDGGRDEKNKGGLNDHDGSP